MEINEFQKLLKTKKKSTKQTYENLKAVKYPKINRWKLYTEKEVCSKCNQSIIRTVVMDFYKPMEHLTLFEVNLIYSLFVLNKIPYDYASYHKCEAGKEFIENLKNVVVE